MQADTATQQAPNLTAEQQNILDRITTPAALHSITEPTGDAPAPSGVEGVVVGRAAGVLTVPELTAAIAALPAEFVPEPRRQPQVGDEAWFYEEGAQLHAKVIHVWSDTCVNLELDSGALRSSVLVIDLDLDTQMPSGYYCVLMDLNDRDEQPPLAGVPCDLTRLEHARALPELEADSVTHPVAFAPGAIESFKGEDGRTMRVVALAGSLWQQPA